MRSQHIQSVSFDTVPLFTKMGNSKHSDAAGIASVASILIFLVAISVFSVARLLTFIAAICALLYVRYTTLRIEMTGLIRPSNPSAPHWKRRRG